MTSEVNSLSFVADETRWADDDDAATNINKLHPVVPVDVTTVRLSRAARSGHLRKHDTSTYGVSNQ